MTISMLPQTSSWQPESRRDQAVFDALAASRAQWRGIAELAFDLCFETDAEGRFVLVSSGALGWSEEALLGRTGHSLLEWPDEDGFDPFHPGAPVRRRRAWLKRSDGSVATVLVSALPVFGTGGRILGAIGGLQDVSEQETRIQAMAEQVQLFRQVGAIGQAMRRAVLPDMVIRIGLEQLLEAVGGYGAVIIGTVPTRLPSDTASGGTATPPAWPVVLHRAGEAPPVPDEELVAIGRAAAEGGAAPWSRTVHGFGRMLLLSAIATHFSEPVTLMLWREPGRGWTASDEAFVVAVMNSFGGVLEHDQVQRELSRQSSVDMLTGLLNRDSFVQQVSRRLDRLDAEGFAATLMLVGLDGFDAINRERGYEVGDQVLRSAAAMLRDAVRPTDLAGRLSGDLFVLWLDGADQFAAAERAEALCKGGVAVELDEPLSLHVSIGLTSRAARSFESTETMLEQAQAALSAIKLAGGGRWHFYNEDSPA